jgi:DNA-binding transcriptional regulator YiaG
MKTPASQDLSTLRKSLSFGPSQLVSGAGRAQAPVTPNTVRYFRERLQLSQSQFAARLGISVETYRTWDSGRRQPPARVVTHAQELASAPRDDEPVPLATLARAVGVHARTLRHAAHTGRLRVTYDTRTTFRHVRLRATRIDVEVFLQRYYKQCYSRLAPRSNVTWPNVPNDFNERIVQLRQRLRLSQARLAERLGAAGRAVVYQWESRKRMPSPVFWQRIERLEQAAARAT